jgi:EPS-associated MarR family transcriptional regulator
MVEQEQVFNVGDSDKEETLVLLSELSHSPHITQRDLSSKLNVSLGKTNYLIRHLLKKGMIKARSFSHNPGKLRKVKYMLTQKGFKEKIRLTYYFLKKKEAEYNYIKAKWEQLALEGEK